MSMEPLSWVMIVCRTTSIPTPRPDTWDTVVAVEKPGKKITFSTC